LSINDTSLSYDVIDLVFSIENYNYDKIRNFQRCCSESWNGTQKEKSLEDSFFTFVDSFSVAKKGSNILYQKVGPKGDHLNFGITKNPISRGQPA